MHPDRVGPYRIDRKIGSGGMGNVYHGVHVETNEEAAVKVLPASVAREEGFVLRFSREVDALRKVSSPHIVKIFLDGQTDDGSYFYSMEYVDGETLTALISRRKRIPWPEVIQISCQICLALKAAHDAGIVHRDLKPSNLMITKDGTVKLADFGVAHVFASTRLTRTGGVVGTAEYMSPEQARGQRASKLSDLYSLGAVMYAMLTGRPPFTGRTAADILQKHQYGQFDRPGHYVPELPRQLEEFVCKLLEKRAEKRLPDAFVAMRQLQNIEARVEYERSHAASPESSVTDNDRHKTAAIDADATAGAGANELQMSRGPATIVRDAIREDIKAQMQKSFLSRLFDNIYVLISLLLLLIAAAYYLSGSQQPTPLEKFEQARAAFEQKPGRNWLRLRDEVLVPLLESGQLPDYQTDIARMIRTANQYEFTRNLKTAGGSDGSAESEIQRQILLAFQMYTAGHVTPAAERLRQVRALLSPEDDFLVQFIDDTLHRWDEENWQAARMNLLTEVINQAREVIRSKSDPRAAIQALNAVISLYGDDPAMAARMEECRSLAQQLSEQQASDKTAEDQSAEAAESPQGDAVEKPAPAAP